MIWFKFCPLFITFASDVPESAYPSTSIFDTRFLKNLNPSMGSLDLGRASLAFKVYVIFAIVEYAFLYAALNLVSCTFATRRDVDKEAITPTIVRAINISAIVKALYFYNSFY